MLRHYGSFVDIAIRFSVSYIALFFYLPQSYIGIERILIPLWFKTFRLVLPVTGIVFADFELSDVDLSNPWHLPCFSQSFWLEQIWKILISLLLEYISFHVYECLRKKDFLTKRLINISSLGLLYLKVDEFF